MMVSRDQIRRYLEKRQCWVSTPGPLETPCWIWTATLNRPGGYGFADVNKQRFTSNRAAYLAWIGDIPDGLKVLHYCDTPPCVNPRHLYAGTMKKNSQDAWERCNGGLGPTRRHDQAKADEARRLWSAGLTAKEIAQRTGMSRSSVYRTVRGDQRPEVRGLGNPVARQPIRTRFSGAEGQVKLLHDAGLSYAEIGKRLGMSRQHAQKLGTGKRGNSVGIGRRRASC